MVEEKLLNAVKDIKDSSRRFMVAEAARKALEIGTDEELRKALIIARESGSTFHVVRVANKTLGFEE
ncbi:MAG: hypothetical protein KAS87_06860 [Candidatus Omnitrophica bacterium]|nr:hypothetical protein [Candidatus Omnitrophota bacterium]